MERLDPKAIAKVNGSSWRPLRDTFLELSNRLLSVDPTAFGELTTIYVKFHVIVGDRKQVYAVVWIRKSSEILVGLALPPAYAAPFLHRAPADRHYPNLTWYFTIKTPTDLPPNLSELAALAFGTVKDLT